ncbi:MAG TPA: hypothetical protein VFX92_12065 [Candidatus Krumholzibacteria bacterium]|nr:hypothetical protein [Candidatus Krumholzibacteria bacterium]
MKTRWFWFMTLGIAVVLATPGGAGADEPGVTAPRYTAEVIRVAISHRVVADFADTLTVNMRERQTVGDTDFSFEVIEFYPEFAIMDSTHAIVSVSADPNNPAFKIRIYENNEPTEDTWAFYGIDIPHYGRTSYLAFKVLSFRYRGELIGDAGAAEPKAEEERK